MSEQQHTSGPWKMELHVSGMFSVNSPSRQICSGARLGLRNGPDDEGNANARLIAAAPDLLAACRLALYEVGGGTKTQDFGEACRLRGEAEKALRAAIAKAGGMTEPADAR